MNKLAAVLKLVRIEHSIMSAVAVIAAELIAGRLPGLPLLLLSLVAPVFLNMTSFAINDYFDIETDRLNKKKRPLVTGDLAPDTALYITGITLVVGVAASYFINTACFEIAIIFGIFDVLYSYKLKDILLVGNSYVALSMAIAFVYGSYVVTPALGPAITIVTVLVFFSGMAREIHGTIRDYRGDLRARGAKTLPMAIGMRSASMIAFALYLCSALLGVYLFLYVAPFRLNIAYSLIFGVAMAMLFYVGVIFITSKRQKDYDRTRNISLAAMAIAIIALLIAPLAPFAYI